MADRPTDAKPSIVTGLFREAHAAERAYAAALQLGYKAEDINVLMTDETKQHFLAQPRETALTSKAAEPTPESSKRAEVLGGPVGGTVGTIAPAVAAIGAALLVPGLGLVAAGPIAVALTAAGTAGVATGLIGAFTNWGIPSKRAEQYERGLRQGGIVIGLEPQTPEHRAELIRQWKAAGGQLIED